MWYYLQHVFSYYTPCVLETYEYINHLQNYLQMKDVKYSKPPTWTVGTMKVHDNDDPILSPCL